MPGFLNMGMYADAVRYLNWMIPVVPRAAKIWYLELAVDEYMEKEREKK